jgi:hypothetical protein
MRSGWTVAALLAAVLLVVPSARAEDFDRTISAPRGARLDVRLFGGEVVVHAWDKDAVRVRATHFRTDTIDLSATDAAVTIRARSRHGTPHAIDFDIQVPAWMPVGIGGTYLDITVEGTQAAVTAETVRGDVKVKGGAGTVSLKSIDGVVALEGARGRAELSSVNNGIRVEGLNGELSADSVNGSVKLRGVQSASVEVSTVGGDISWDGAVTGNGRYQLATHNGDVDVTLPDRSNVTVNVRAFQGEFSCAFPAKLPDEAGRHRRFSFILGSGAARLDLETFGGTINVRRGGAGDASGGPPGAPGLPR